MHLKYFNIVLYRTLSRNWHRDERRRYRKLNRIISSSPISFKENIIKYYTRE